VMSCKGMLMRSSLAFRCQYVGVNEYKIRGKYLSLMRGHPKSAVHITIKFIGGRLRVPPIEISVSCQIDTTLVVYGKTRNITRQTASCHHQRKNDSSRSRLPNKGTL
jgi:hypothetical protein